MEVVPDLETWLKILLKCGANKIGIPPLWQRGVGEIFTMPGNLVQKVNAKKIDAVPIPRGTFRRKESEYGTCG